MKLSVDTEALEAFIETTVAEKVNAYLASLFVTKQSVNAELERVVEAPVEVAETKAIPEYASPNYFCEFDSNNLPQISGSYFDSLLKEEVVFVNQATKLLEVPKWHRKNFCAFLRKYLNKYRPVARGAANKYVLYAYPLSLITKAYDDYCEVYNAGRNRGKNS